MIRFLAESRLLSRPRVASAALIIALAVTPAYAQVIFMSQSSNTVGAYNAVTGTPINTAFISGPNAYGLAVDSNNHLFVSNGSFNTTVGEYNATTGVTINAAFIQLPPTQFIVNAALSLDGNNHLFVSNNVTNTVGEYNATTGATISAAFINGQGLNNGAAMALDAVHNHLFVTSLGATSSWVGEYDATTGATINANFITFVGNANGGLALDGNNHLFVVDNFNGIVGEYDAITGAPINAAFITGLGNPVGVALDGNHHLFVSHGNVVGEFDATTGATINGAFINHGGSYLAFASAVPDPSSLVLLTGAAGVSMWRRKWLTGPSVR
jgi:hypothetical protein